MNKTFYIDNITWNDLSLDEIYARLNSCVSSAGDDYLYERLRNPYICDCAELSEQKDIIKEIKDLNNKEILLTFLNKVSKLKHYKFKDVIYEFSTLENKSNLKHIIIDFLIIAAFILIFFFPGVAMVSFFAIIAYSVSDYFKTKDIIASKLTVFNFLIKMLKSASLLKDYNLKEDTILYKKIKTLNDINKCYKPFMFGTFLISEGAKTNSNPFSVIFDYIRMIFHVDIIKYNSMINFIKEHSMEACEYYDIVGLIDAAICLSNINDSELNIADLCESKLDDSYEFMMTEAYHPLIKEAVSNSISTGTNVLITGCNASGKSTFLKTVALNALFSQCFGFCFASEYRAPYFRIFSSMALKDDIDKGESYFMSEIKSLKRIIDATNCKDGNVKILCVIDEVLRGTNTVERIAASVEILKSFNNAEVLCFVATHDIELTELLKEGYTNYHFSEEILNDDVIFSYKINSGKANSRNAIRLLSVLGYDEKIVNNASNRADRFVKAGVWE